MPPTGGGQLGMGGDDPCGDHGADEIALATGLGSQQRIKPQALHRCGDNLNGAMTARTDDLESLIQGHKGLSLQ